MRREIVQESTCLLQRTAQQSQNTNDKPVNVGKSDIFESTKDHSEGGCGTYIGFVRKAFQEEVDHHRDMPQ